MAYDYRVAVKADVKEWLADNFEYLEDAVDDTADVEAVAEFLNDELWADDAITGNGSGSYTMDREQAKEYVMANMPLAVEACREFDCIDKFADKVAENDWEWLDVTIRCYVLGEAIGAVIADAEALRGEDTADA